MQVCIHRGTCIEIAAEGKRLVLDLGLPLDRDAHVSLPLVV